MGVLDKLPLRQKIILDVPQDVIPVEGINEVNEYLHQQLYSKYPHLKEYPDYDRYLNRDFPRDWNMTKGGTFTKRVGNFFYTHRKIKLTPEQLSHLGNIAKRHCTKSSHFVFDFTDVFDWRAGDFGDANSCYWNSNRGARRLLTFYKARAVRFYNPEQPEKGIARAWLAPLVEPFLYNAAGERLPATKELMEDGFVVFNGYGHETQRCARILSTHLGLTYQAIGLCNYGGTNGVLWINHYATTAGGVQSSAAFVVGPVGHYDKVQSLDLRYNVDLIDMENCSGTCGRRYRTRDMRQALEKYYCTTCYDALFFVCAHCQEHGLKTDSKRVIIGTVKGIKHESWCQKCTEAETVACVNCKQPISQNLKITPEESEDPWCRSCFVDHYKRCDTCELWKPIKEFGKEKACKNCR